MKAVIMAGGKGTRLKEITGDETPKPMARISGKPILEHQILRLKENGITDITLIVGYLKEKIIDYFKDGQAFGVKISYITENEPLGTAGALYCLKDKNLEDILLVFGDTIFDIDFHRMAEFHKRKNAKLTLFVHPNSHPYDSDLIIVGDGDRVTGFDSKNNVRNYLYHNTVNAGMYFLSPQVLDMLNKPVKTDFDKEIVQPLIKENSVYAYCSTEYIKDAGTPDRIASVEKDIQNGVVSAKNLSRKQKCIFLDRDGTVNVLKGFIRKPEEIELIDGAAEAIKLINKSGYLALLVTNQPVVARGECTIEEVNNINAALEVLLGKEGAYLDDIRFCPHHTDKGFEGERPEYKINCNCRKPKTGMIDYFVDKYNIDKEKSFIIGDTEPDIQTGINAGLKTLKIGGLIKAQPDYYVKDVLEAVKIILNKEC